MTEGHRDYFTGEMINHLPVGRVISDSHPGRWFKVIGFPEITGEVRFECYANDDFRHASSGKLVPCKHAALHARRLERMKYLVWNDGRFWIADEHAPKIDPACLPDDVFAGLPS